MIELSEILILKDLNRLKATQTVQCGLLYMRYYSPRAYLSALIMNYGATGAWMAMLAFLVIQGVLMTWRFHKGRWKELPLME